MPDEAQTWKRLRKEGALVEEEDGELVVYRARSDELMRLAAQLDRMAVLDATFNSGAPVIRGPELCHLKGHARLRDLDVTNMPISGENLDVLTTLPNLRVLRCTPSSNIADALVHIGKCKALRVLSMNGRQISDAVLYPLNGLEYLEELILSGNPVSSGLSVIKTMKRLRYLSLDDTRADDGVLAILPTLEQLEELYVASPIITDTGVKPLSECKKLHSLAVGSPRVTSNGVAELVQLSHLRYLHLDVNLSNKTIREALGGMQQLTKLLCEGANISAAARKRVATLLPKCDIVWLGTDDDEVVN